MVYFNSKDITECDANNIDFSCSLRVFLYSIGESHCPCETPPTPPGVCCNYHCARSHIVSSLNGSFKGQYDVEGKVAGTALPMVKHGSLQVQHMMFVSCVFGAILGAISHVGMHFSCCNCNQP